MLSYESWHPNRSNLLCLRCHLVCLSVFIEHPSYGYSEYTIRKFTSILATCTNFRRTRSCHNEREDASVYNRCKSMPVDEFARGCTFPGVAPKPHRTLQTTHRSFFNFVKHFKPMTAFIPPGFFILF